MITAGLDMGYMNVKALVLSDGQILGHSMVRGGLDTRAAAERAVNQALQKAGLSRDKIERIVATGSGRNDAPFADDVATDITCDAKGAFFLFPSARSVIDVGAEEGKSIRLDAQGKVKDFATNEKCGAGAGAFIEAMARALEVDLDTMSQLSLSSTKTVPMNAQCVIFAESEVVSLIHAKTPKEDISRAVYDGLSSRIEAMALKTGVEKDVVLIGGVANSAGFVDSLKRGLKLDLLIPENRQAVAALGAALYAAGK